MPKKLITPPAARLHDLYEYDPTTGALWSKRRRRSHPIKKTNNKGYIQIEVDGVQYCAHKIIFKMMTGRDPIHDVDHEDKNPSNNRWVNLREATQSQNQGNAKGRGAPGTKGTSYKKRINKFQATIQVDKKHVYLGVFSTQAEAHAAYCAAAHALFGAFANHG